MYKVFFNDRIVFINTDLNKETARNGLCFEGFQDEDLPKIWKSFVEDMQGRDLYLTGETASQAKDLFFANFKIIAAAGGLVFNQYGQLLCIERWGKWDLPKGKIEKGESKEQAALREVGEETGLRSLQLVELKDTTYHIYQSVYHKRWILKPTYWYKMIYTGIEKPVPQVNEDIIKAVWFDVSQLDEVRKNTYASLLDLFKIW